MKDFIETRVRVNRAAALGVAVAATIVAAVSFGCKEQDETLVYKPIHRTTTTFQPSGNLPDLLTLDAMFADMAAFASEAVVQITVRAGRRNGRFVPAAGEGSGFILTSDGRIVTNDHVVASVDEVTVTLADSNDVRPGQFALAAGSPFGLENSVTFGHISAIGRPGIAGDGAQQSRRYSGMIQTDASINPGNSGGPLINIQGQVIGVNTSIYSATGASTGIGFAIPSNVVLAVADELIQTGKFDRGLMGVRPRDMKPYEIGELNFQGAFITWADPGSPAHDAGMREGDVITKIGSLAISNEIDLRVAMYRHSPKDTVKVTYMRDGKAKSVSVTLAAPENLQAVQPPQRDTNPFSDRFPTPGQQQRPRLGVEIYDVDDPSRDQYGLPDDLEGAVITNVLDGSLADRAGLKEGDVIMQVNGKSIEAADVRAVMDAADWGDEVLITYVRIRDGETVERRVRIRLRLRP